MSRAARTSDTHTRRWRRCAAAALVAAIAGPAGPLPHPSVHAAPVTVEVVSINDDGSPAAAYSNFMDVSAGGDVLYNAIGRGLMIRSGSTSTQVVGGADWYVARAGISDNGRYVAWVTNTNVIGDNPDSLASVVVLDRSDNTLDHLITLGVTTYQFESVSQIDISDDGRYVVFDTIRALDPLDTNDVSDVYRFDRTDDSIDWVSISPTGVVPDGLSRDSRMTPDGRMVVFGSDATNLVADDTNAITDVFVWTAPYESGHGPAPRGWVQRVTTDATGGQLTLPAYYGGDLSDSGRYVVFASSDWALDPQTFIHAVYRKDLYTGTLESATNQPGGYSTSGRYPTISADGWVVAYEGDWTRRLTGQQGSHPQMMATDFVSGNVELLSRTPAGETGNSQTTYGVITPDGSSVLASSFATDLAPVNGANWVVVRMQRHPDPLPVAVGTGAGGLADFTAATAGETIDPVGFDSSGLSDGQDLSTTYAAQGLTLTGLSARATSTFTHTPPFGAQASGYGTPSFTGDFSFDFATPVAAFGMWTTDIEADLVIRVHLVDGRTIALPLARPLDKTNFFLGYTTAGNDIVRIDVESPGDLFIIDDLQIGRRPTDTTPPTVIGVPDRGPDAGSWYGAPVTIDWQATDPAVSSGVPTDPADTVAGLAGTTTYTSGDSCDPAGNCAHGTLDLSIDLDAPATTFSTCAATMIRGTSGITVVGTVADADSGLVSATRSLDGAAPVPITGGAFSVAIPRAIAAGPHALTVSATDLVGHSSTTTCSFTTYAVPGTARLAAVPVASGEAVATWSAPNNLGGGVTGYEVELLNGTAVLRSATVPATDTTLTWTALSNGVTYDVRVRAINPAGSGPWSTRTVRPSPVVTIAADGTGAVLEGNTGTRPIAFTVSIDRPSVLPVTVTVATRNGTASANDYTASTTTVTIPAGSLTAPTSVNVVGDRRVEPNETFVVRISAPVNARRSTVFDATGTITNDD